MMVEVGTPSPTRTGTIICYLELFRREQGLKAVYLSHISIFIFILFCNEHGLLKKKKRHDGNGNAMERD